jgi:hypothetical protein
MVKTLAGNISNKTIQKEIEMQPKNEKEIKDFKRE